MGFEPENFFPHCVMWWGDLEIWLKLFSLGCQFISFIKKLFRWIPTALCCCGWCTASLLSDINKSLLMNSDSCIELLWCKTRSVAMMYLVVISFKKTSLMCHHIHQLKRNLKLWKMTIFQFSKNSFRLEQYLEPSRGEMSNCSSRTIKTKENGYSCSSPRLQFSLLQSSMSTLLFFTWKNYFLSSQNNFTSLFQFYCCFP